MDDYERFARALPNIPEAPSGNAMALGHLMREWLQNAHADSGTHVDTGGGFHAYDLWVKFGGEELFITIRSKAK